MNANIAMFPAAPVHRTPGTSLEWSTLEQWLDAWHVMQGRRWRGPRIQAEQAHVEALDDATIRACDSVAVLEEVREIARERRWRDRKPVGPGGETASVLVRMRCHNQAQRVRAKVPNFAAMALELELQRERVQVTR